MITHIVLLKFRDSAEGANKEQNLRKAQSMLQALKEKIAWIKAWEIGTGMPGASDAYELVLNSRFESADDLKRYQSHPDHVRVLEFLAKVQSSKAVIDYESRG